MELLLGIFTAFGLSASAGLNAYIPLLVVGVIAHYFPNTLNLAQPFDLLANPWILILLGVLVIIEMVADKVPAVNHINDLIQTVIRPVAGAIAFAASANVITDVNPVLALACGLLVAGSVHTVKAAAVRPAVTAATGGTGNIPVSIAEDIFATLASILAIVLPIIAGALVIILLTLLIWWWANRRQKSQSAQSRL
ncbi:MAG: DUF4126 domain-containing protein [Anaerolineae bacterium]|jgi:uncharacterized membrane protein|nr:DUF4126 domain-containing protein [Anaerolineae bacterium]